MSDTLRYYERFALVDTGAWFRILPTGTFQRFGRDVSIGQGEIADMVRNFTAGVPETGVPVKPSHNDAAGKVGDIAAVEARADGLYARVNWLDSGLKLLKDGAFQFFSAEILWGEIQHEGRAVSNILMGLALVNDPFFGKATALFSLVDQVEGVYWYREFTPEQRRTMADKGEAMPDGSYPIVTVADLGNAIQAWGRSPDEPTKRHIIKRARALGRTDLLPADWEGSTKEKNMSVADELKGVLEGFGIKPATPPAPVAPVPVTETAEYKALAAKNTEAEQKLAEADKAKRLAGNVEKFSAALKIDKFETPKGLAEKFAAVAEADAHLADALVKDFRALVEQAAQGKLFAEFGTTAPGGEGKSDAEKFEAMSKAIADDKKVDITEAYAIVAREQPDLYRAYTEASAKRK